MILFILLSSTLYMMVLGRFAARISFLSLSAYLCVLLSVFAHFPHESTLLLSDGLLHIDLNTLSSYLFLGFIACFIILRASDIGWEFHLMILSGLTGAFYLLSSYDWVVSAIAFEFINLSTYLILSLYRGTETATLKYLLLSAFFTTIFLLSISIFYSLTGTTHFDDLFAALPFIDPSLAIWPQLLLLLTVSFKLGLFPTHLWVPDVYDGLPTSLLLWMGTIPKAAILLWLPCILPLFSLVTPFTLGIGVISFVLGAIALASQYKLRRFLAFSSIGHLGILFTAFAVSDFHAYGYYIAIYFLATLSMLLILSEVPNVDTLKGLSVLTLHKPLAFGFLIALLTMAAVPPFAGFYAKLLVLFSYIDLKLLPFAALLVLTSLRSAAYYLKLLQTTFFQKTVSSELTVQYPYLIALATTLILPTTQLLFT